MQVFLNLIRVSAVAAVLIGAGSIMPGNTAFFGAHQAEAAVARSILVEGNTRIEDDTVRAYLTIQPGRSYGPADVDESLKALFATGLFADVKINQSGGSLVVTVTENPIINKISFEGNKRLSDESLTGTIRSTERAVLTRARVQSDVQRILEAYRRSGRFRAEVEPKIIERSNKRADLVFEINEGDKTGVERITFIGNQAFSDGRLQDVIRTRESGLLSWLRSSDVYDPDRLAADQELLRRYYYKKGYADFRIVSAIAELDREQNVFYVTFTVEEGEKYTFGEIDIQTSLAALDTESLRGTLRTETGDTYNSEAVEKTLEDLTIEVSQLGYAFAQVRPRGDRDYENRTIAVTYYIEEGPRAYVERINIRGNDRTREYVIRREFDLAEGDAFNRVLIDKAERRLKNLDYFKNVRITTERGSAPDRVIVNVDVEEKPTGEVSFGIGYSTTDGVIGDVSVTEKNFLGRGQYVRVAVGGGDSRQTYEFSFTEPYFMGRRISLSLDAYRKVLENTNTRIYDEETTGGGVGFGLPLRDDEFRLNLFYKIYQTDIDVPPPPAVASAAVRDAQGKRLTSIIGYSLVYNTLDNNQAPTDGFYAKFQQEFAGVGGDTSFIRTTAEGRYYREILPEWGVVGMVKGSAGHVLGVGKRLRVNDHFFKGGETVRGFDSNGIGPRDGATGDALGGRMFVAGTVEATFPFPYIPKELGLSGAVFADAGSLWDVDPDTAKLAAGVRSNDFSLRASVGVGIEWKSPFGPLRADFAYPLLKENADEVQIFRLGGGTRF